MSQGLGLAWSTAQRGLGLLWGPGKATPLLPVSQPLWEGCNELILTLSSHNTDFQGLPLGFGSGPRASSVPMCWAVPTVAPSIPESWSHIPMESPPLQGGWPLRKRMGQNAGMSFPS